MDLGFSADAVQTFSIGLPDSHYGQPQLRQEFVERLLARLSTRPDVASAGAITGLPLTNARFGISTSTIDGVTLSDDEQDRLTLQVRIITPDYFKTLSIPIKQGRGFTAADRIGSQPVLLLNETAVQRIWPGGCALGHQLEIGTGFGMGRGRASGTVVGVVGDVRDYGPASRPAADVVSGARPVAGRFHDDRREEPRRAVGPDRTVARAAARDGCRRADVCGSIDAADSRHRRRPTAALPGPDWLLRDHGHVAGRDRSVRRAGLRGGTTHARDRHSPGAGRETWRGVAHGDVASRQAWSSLAWGLAWWRRCSPAACYARNCSKWRQPTRSPTCWSPWV